MKQDETMTIEVKEGSEEREEKSKTTTLSIMKRELYLNESENRKGNERALWTSDCEK